LTLSKVESAQQADDGARARVLLVTVADSYRTTPYLIAAAELGCDVTVATDANVAIEGAAIVTPMTDPVAAADRIMQQEPNGFDAVIGTDGRALAVAAEVGRRLLLTANSAESLNVAANKLEQRRCAAAAGISQPRFADVETSNWSVFPAVVKPVDRSGSQGVLRADSHAELIERVGQIREIVGLATSMIVEEFVSGTEVAVEGVLHAGVLTVLGTFDKPDTPTGPTFPETLLIRPARLDESTRRSAADLAQRCCDAIGLTEGPVHVELIVADGSVWFIELAARTIGGLCGRTLRLAGGSLERYILLSALGKPAPLVTEAVASGVLMLHVPHDGAVEAVDGVDAALAVSGINDVVISVGVGERVEALPRGIRYLGFIFAAGDHPDDVETALRDADAKLTVSINASMSGSTDPNQRSDR
jgi:biotin carboxylase